MLSSNVRAGARRFCAALAAATLATTAVAIQPAAAAGVYSVPGCTYDSSYSVYVCAGINYNLRNTLYPSKGGTYGMSAEQYYASVTREDPAVQLVDIRITNVHVFGRYCGGGGTLDNGTSWPAVANPTSGTKYPYLGPWRGYYVSMFDGVYHHIVSVTARWRHTPGTTIYSTSVTFVVPNDPTYATVQAQGLCVNP
jgi:hypothetical protein